MPAAAAPAAAGSMVMAIGIFGLAALQQMPAAQGPVTQALAIGLLVAWALLASRYAAAWLERRFQDYTRPPIGAFAIGSWVAATAVLLRLILLGVPEWRPLSLALGLLALAVWLWFLKIVLEHLRTVVGDASRVLVPGVVLLPAVSTQALALAALELFPGRPSLVLAGAGIALGAIMYLVGAALVAWSHLRVEGWSLADDWDNTNCILHGAMSITGLAAVAWGIGPPALAVALWLYVFAVFVAVEAIEVARLLARVRLYGWRRGAFAYRVTQWSRNFTFGMFYAFTLALSQTPAFAGEPPWMQTIQSPILDYGPHMVLAFLLVEIALWLDSRLAFARARPPSGA